MKRRFLRVISLSLSIIMMFSLVIGCSSSKTETDPKTSVNQDIGVAKDGFPIVKEKVTINMMAPQAAGQKAFAEMDTFLKLEEMSNVHIQWDQIPASGVNEKKNLSLASNELPEAYFGMKVTSSDESNYGSQGVFLPFDKYLDNYMPNMKKLMAQYPSLKPQITSPDSHIYCLPEVNERLRDMVWGRLWMNQKWLAKLGLKQPANLDEFYNVLKAFKEKDPNGNGKADEIPLNTLLDLGIWGISNVRDAWIDVKNGKLRFIATEANFKDFLQFHAKLYQEKLLEQEVFSQAAKDMLAKGQQEMIGCSVVPGTENYFGTKLWSDYDFVNPPIKGPYGDQMVTAEGVDNLAITKGTFVMTKVNKHPEVTARWVDFNYSVDGDRLFLSGIEGKTYKNNPDGTWELLIPQGVSRKDFFMQWTFTQGGSIYPRLFSGDSWGLKEAAQPANQVANKAAAALKQYGTKEILPNLNFTPQEQDRLNVLQADINTYVKSMQTKFIMGAEPISNWDNYVSTIKKMGLDELMKIFQAAYDRYNKSK